MNLITNLAASGIVHNKEAVAYNKILSFPHACRKRLTKTKLLVCPFFHIFCVCRCTGDLIVELKHGKSQIFRSNKQTGQRLPSPGLVYHDWGFHRNSMWLMAPRCHTRSCLKGKLKVVVCQKTSVIAGCLGSSQGSMQQEWQHQTWLNVTATSGSRGHYFPTAIPWGQGAWSDSAQANLHYPCSLPLQVAHRHVSEIATYSRIRRNRARHSLCVFVCASVRVFAQWLYGSREIITKPWELRPSATVH